MLALFKIPAHLGYAALFALVGVESAGVPVPGETALIASGVLAQRGQLSIELVIVVAAVGAIVGDNIGYLIGRTRRSARCSSARAPLRAAPARDHRQGRAVLRAPRAEGGVPRAVGGLAARSPRRGLPASTTCRGRCSCSGTRSAESRGPRRSGCSPTTSATRRSGIFKIGGIAAVAVILVSLLGYAIWRRRVR